MYRKCSIIGMLAAVVLLSAAAGPVAATLTDWSYGFFCTTTKLYLGTCTGALDSFESFDSRAPDIWIDPPIVLVWSDLGGARLDADYRLPLVAGQAKTWTIKAGRIKQTFFPVSHAFSWSPGRATPPVDGLPNEWTASLTLTGVPFGSPYSGPTFWDLTGGQSGSTSLPMYWMGSGSPVYTFEFRVTAIPEPASILALCGSLGSLLFLRRAGRMHL